MLDTIIHIFEVKRTPYDICNNIISHIDNNLSDRNIAAITSVSRTTVQNIRREYRPDKTPLKIGRPCKLTANNKQYLVKSVTSGKLDTETEANEQLKSKLKIDVSDQTVRRALNEAGLKSKEKTKRPLLSKKNIADRYAFAKRHLDWTIKDWERVI